MAEMKVLEGDEPSTQVTRPPALTGTMRTRLAGGLEQVRRLNDSLARFLWERQVPPDRVHDVQLVAEELITNVIRHGGVEKGQARLTVEVEIGADDIRLTVEDNGLPFDPTTAGEVPLGVGLENRRPGGHGLRIVRRIVDELAYRRLPEGNLVVVRLPLESGDGDDE